MFQAPDCSFLVITKKADVDPDCEQLYGTFQIAGQGTFSIENTGECGVNVIIQKTNANAGHVTYNERITDDTELPIEVRNIKSCISYFHK